MPSHFVDSPDRFALWCSFDGEFIARYARPGTVCSLMEATLLLCPDVRFRVHKEDGAPPPTPAVVPAFLLGDERAELRASLVAEPEAA